MGRRRHGDEHTRHNRTRSYPGTYERRGPPDEGLHGPYYDRRGNRYFEDSRGSRYYDEDFAEPYYRDYERDRYERESRQSTRRTAIKWAGIVAVALVLVVGMVMATDEFAGGPDSAQQAPQQGVPQQPVQPQQPIAPQQPQAPSPQAPSPQAPAAPQPGGASSEQVEGMRADIDRQLAEIRQSLNQLRLEIWSLFTSQQNEQQEGSP